MSRWRANAFRRPFRSLAPVALLALAPKCVVCALAYAGLGAALGLGGPEMCGAPAGSPGSWASSLAWSGVTLGLGVIGFLVARRRHRGSPPVICTAD
jgi:hypothetical protein